MLCFVRASLSFLPLSLSTLAPLMPFPCCLIERSCVQPPPFRRLTVSLFCGPEVVPLISRFSPRHQPALVSASETTDSLPKLLDSPIRIRGPLQFSPLFRVWTTPRLLRNTYTLLPHFSVAFSRCLAWYIFDCSPNELNGCCPPRLLFPPFHRLRTMVEPVGWPSFLVFRLTCL